MKQSIFNNAALLRFLLVLIPLQFLSCKKDEISSRELMVFLQPDVSGIPTFTQRLALTHTPADIRGERNTEFYAYISREIEHAVEITLEPAPDLIASYNALYELNCELLPADAYELTSGNTYTIEAGQRQSNAIQVSITQPEILTNPNGYVIPLAISKVTSKDKGAVISNTHKAVYLRVDYLYSNVENTEIVPAGNLADRTGWAVSVSNNTNGAPGSNILDGNNSSVWRSSNSSTAAKWIQMDMGAARNMLGLQLTPNHNNTNENGTRITVLTSNDNITWTTQGIWEGTGPASGTSSSNPDYKGIQFIGPVTARYFRLEYNAWVAGNRVGLAELNVIE